MTNDSKTLARRFFEEVWNDGDESAIDRYIAADAAGNDPDFGAGRDVFRTQWRMWRTAFPDLHFAVDDLVAEGNKVVTRWTLIGSHLGEFQGIPATGRRVSVTGTSLDRIVDGQIAESFDGWDALGLRRQSGVIAEGEGEGDRDPGPVNVRAVTATPQAASGA